MDFSKKKEKMMVIFLVAFLSICFYYSNRVFFNPRFEVVLLALTLGAPLFGSLVTILSGRVKARRSGIVVLASFLASAWGLERLIAGGLVDVPIEAVVRLLDGFELTFFFNYEALLASFAWTVLVGALSAYTMFAGKNHCYQWEMNSLAPLIAFAGTQVFCAGHFGQLWVFFQALSACTQFFLVLWLNRPDKQVFTLDSVSFEFWILVFVWYIAYELGTLDIQTALGLRLLVMFEFRTQFGYKMAVLDILATWLLFNLGDLGIQVLASGVKIGIALCQRDFKKVSLEGALVLKNFLMAFFVVFIIWKALPLIGSATLIVKIARTLRKAGFTLR